MNEIIESLKFFLAAFYVVIIASASLSNSGIFLYQRRSLFLGAALPQIAGFGLLISALFTENKIITYAVVLVLCVLILGWHSSKGSVRLENDAFIGIGFAVSMAGSLLIMAKSSAETHAYESMFKGGILASVPKDIYFTAAICIPALLLLTIFKRRLLMVNMAPVQAELNGLNKWRIYEYLQFICISATIIISMESLGTMGTFAFLLFPVITLCPFAKNANCLFYLCPLLGIIAGVSGLYVSIEYDLPAGPSIVGVLFILWILATILKRVIKLR
ncbi:MAG: metal ABC transporter permease [Candidatus Riflebacteria bacterium]|nr:metal ABC transporter permease [Candidatus Riflebacteria bacterium]